MLKIFTNVSLLALALVAVTLGALALHPAPPRDLRKPIFQGIRIDESTLALFQRACQNCHSENTEWPWYSRIPPGSWVIGKDVENARRHVNFSKWETYPPDLQEQLLTRIGSAVRAGYMPLRRYTLLHREAVLALPERQQIYEWSKAEKKRLRPAESRPSASVSDPR